jgi:AcrR family transcriptional regulator
VAARMGLDREQVVDAAVGILAHRGSPEAVALSEVAERLGIRTQSLYAHVDGVDGLRRELALRGLRALAAKLTDASIGRSGRDAIEAIVVAWVRFAREQPGLYAASLRAPGDDPELVEAIRATTNPLNLVFRSYGLDDVAAGHWYRLIFSSVHGFAVLRSGGLLTMLGDPDDTVRHMIRVFARQLELDAAPAGGR